MATDDSKQELRDLIDGRVAAVASRDAEALAAQQAADVLAFNVLPRCDCGVLTRWHLRPRRGSTGTPAGLDTKFATFTLTPTAASGTAPSYTT